MTGDHYEATTNQVGLYAVHSLGGAVAASANVCFQIAWEGALDLDRLRRAFSGVAQEHDALRTFFQRVERALVARVAEAVELPCTEFDLRELSTAQQREQIERLISEDGLTVLPLDSAPLVRLRVLKLGDVHGLLSFTFHHSVVDGASAAIFMPSLARAYRELSAEGNRDVLSGVAAAEKSHDVAAEKDPRDRPTQLSTVAAAEKSALNSGAWDEAISRWRKKLAGNFSFPRLALGAANPEQHFARGIEATAVLTPSTLAGVRTAARKARTTPFVVLLAAVKALLFRVTGVRDGAVFSTFANRKKYPDVLGYLVNTLPLRDRVEEGDGFALFLERVAGTVRLAKETAYLPAGWILRELIPRELEAPFPLLNVLIDTPPTEYEAAAAPDFGNGLRTRLVSNRAPLAAEWVVGIAVRGEQARVTFRYAGSEDEQPALNRLVAGFEELLSEALAFPERPLGELNWIPEADRRQILAQSSGPKLEMPHETVNEQLRAQLERTPEAIAFVAAETRLTYRELDKRISEIAEFLASRGAAPDRFVLMTVGGEAGALGVLAALRLGAPWLNVGPAPGRSRLSRTIEVCSPGVAIADEAGRELLAGLLPEARLINASACLLKPPHAPSPSTTQQECVRERATNGPLRDSPARFTGEAAARFSAHEHLPASLRRSSGSMSNLAAVRGTSKELGAERTIEGPLSSRAAQRRGNSTGLAYAILTSGTTGQPKLVAVEQRALAAQLASLVQTGIFGAAPRIALLAPLTFDASLEQLLLPLITGGTVVIPPDGALEKPDVFWKLLSDERVNVFDAVPSLARTLLPSAPKEAELERFILGGEALAPSLVGQIKERFPTSRVFDTYGPTETTINACLGERDGDDVSIGRPIPGMRALVLDDSLQLVPVGFPGQLALSGPCVARGYLGEPQSTAAVFVPSPFEPQSTAAVFVPSPFEPQSTSDSYASNERLYLSGDRARWNEQGRLELFGRADGQVKVRGVRVDLHEIEQVLQAFPGVEEALVVRREQAGRALLVAAYTSRQHACDEPLLRAHLSSELPRGHLPDVLFRLEALPRLPNGKLNRDGLALPDRGPRGPHEEGTREAQIAAWMGTALGLTEMPAPEDDFFELGGDSLALIALVTRAAEEGLELTAHEVRALRTPRALAQVCRETSSLRTRDLPPSNEEARKALGNAEAFQRPIERVLLTGATGLLGIHLLEELLKQTAAEILCLVRAPSEEAAQTKLTASWERAFPGQAFPTERVQALSGDLQEVQLGVTDPTLLERIDTVLHCAANVGWAASSDLLERTNVEGTRRVAALARRVGARLHYVSTSSVVNASARNLPYVASKVKAEHVVLESGLPARIWRVGLLSARARDGVFPVGAEESGLLLLLTALIGADELPEDLQDSSLELTPVDSCAEFLVRLMKESAETEPICSLQTDRPLPVRLVFKLRAELTAPLPRGLSGEFLSEVLRRSEEPTDAALASTKNVLESRGLSWPEPDEAYLRRFLG